MKEDVEKLRKTYSEELARKDKIIQELREENTLLMKMSLKSANDKINLKEKVHKLQRD